MNFESLKNGFLLYLSEKYQKDGDTEQAQKVLQSGSACIFQNFSAFKEYLNKQLGNVKGLESISIADLDKLDFKNGKFVVASDEDDITTEALNSMLEDEDFKNSLDVNKDKNLDKTETINFLSGISDNGNISFDKLNEQYNKTVNNTEESELKPPVTIDSILSDKNIASIFHLDSPDKQLTDKEFADNETTNEEITEEEKELASSFIKSLMGNSEELTEDAQNSLLKLFDSDGDGVISEKDSKKAREMLSALTGDKELTAEDFDIFGKFAESVFNKDKNMTTEGFIDFIKGLDGNNSELTVEDFKKIREYQGLGITPTTQEDEVPSTDTPAPAVTDDNPSSDTNSPENINGNSDGGANGTSSGGKSAFSPAIKEKDVSNLSIDELEKELSSAQQAEEDAKNKYMAGVETADKELAEKIKNLQTEIDTKQQKIGENDSKITAQEQTVKAEEDAVKNADNKINDIESQLSSLKEPKKSDFPETDEGVSQYSKQKDAYTTKKAELEQKLKDAKEEKSAAEGKLKTANEELENIKTQKTTLEQELETFNTTMTQYEAEADKLAVSNTELQSLKEAYDKSKEYVNTVQTTLDKRKAEREKKENGDKLPLSYNLDGKEYHCVGIQGIDTNGDGKNDVEFDSFEQFQRYMAQGGVANIGQYGTMQCFNYSQQYGEVIMGVADSRFTSALVAETQGQQGDSDTAGKMATQSEYNKRNFAQVKSANRDEEYEVIKNELQSGRPCVVSVPYQGGCHYALAIGMSDDGDVLIMDSYNCSIQRLGMSRSSDTKSERRNLATGNGVWIYMPGYSFSYSDKRGIDYNYYLQHGQKATLDRILAQRG